jgi:hypothetical protein
MTTEELANEILAVVADYFAGETDKDAEDTLHQIAAIVADVGVTNE